jgi:hypothetical protein
MTNQSAAILADATLEPPMKFDCKQVGGDWRLFHERRLVGRVVPDTTHPGVWRVKLPGGVSDMVNFSRAKDAARLLAIRQMERNRNAAEIEKKVVRNQGAFSRPSSPMRLNGEGLAGVPLTRIARPRAIEESVRGA